MPVWMTVSGAVLAVFAVVAAGAVMRRLRWLTTEADESLLAVVVRLLVPCLILKIVLGNEALRHPINLLLPPAIGLAAMVLGFGAAWLWVRGLGRWCGLDLPVKGRTFTFIVGVYNYYYIPLPLAAVLFKGDAAVLGVLTVLQAGVEFGLWTIGVMVLTGGGREGKDRRCGGASARSEETPYVVTTNGLPWRKLINPVSVTIIVGVVLNFLRIDEHAPVLAMTMVMKAVEMLGGCAIPLALLLIGAMVSDNIRGANWAGAGRVITGACVLRLLLLPAMVLAATRFLPLPHPLKQVMVLEAAMPAAMFPIVMTRYYGGDSVTALRVVIGTSIVGLVTIPIWVWVGMTWVL